MKNKRKYNGISLITLIIVVVVLVILAAALITNIIERNTVESAKMAKFASNYKEMEERVVLYQGENIIQKATSNKNNPFFPVVSKISQSEKEEITNNNSTLKEKVEELSGKMLEEVNLYWIDNELAKTQQLDRYVIDIDTGKIYKYDGETIYKKVWHTLDGGVLGSTNKKIIEENDIWDGWIKLTLYYPSGSTERQWRIGEEGETRYDGDLIWQNYTGPITVRLSDVENVWIKYKLGGDEVVIPPAGKVLVDIQADSYLPTIKDKVKIKIAYDKNASVKEYKVGHSGWQEYTGEFYVTENTIVEARAKVVNKISDSDGNVVGETEKWGRDNIYVGNIGIPESELEAPTLTKKDATVDGEIAKVEAIYPEGAVKKVYKINYGEERAYTEEISVKKYDTYIIAYYYDANGNRSKSRYMYIKEDEPQTGIYIPIPPGDPPENNPDDPDDPDDPGDPGDPGYPPHTPTYVIPEPTISVNPTQMTNSVTITVKPPMSYDKIYVKVGNKNYIEYTGGIEVENNTFVKAYYTTLKGENSSVAKKSINNIKPAVGPYVQIEANPDSLNTRSGIQKVQVTMATDGENLEYSTNGVEYQSYTGTIEITSNCRVYGRAKNSGGSTVEYIDITNIGNNPPTKKDKLFVSINATPEPKLTNDMVDKVSVNIEYDQKSTKKYYSLEENGTLIEYTGPFTLTANTTVYAYALNDNGYGSASKLIDNLSSGIAKPQIIADPKNNVQTSKVKVTIEYDKNSTVTRYKINNGSYTDYIGEITIEENCVITAYCINKLGQEATSSYRVTNIIEEIPSIVLDMGEYYLVKLNYPKESTGREYKYENEEWKTYNEQGILLIKPEYKDKILNSKGEIKIKIVDENGKKIDFTGDYYFLTTSIQEVMQNISLRWDRTPPNEPQIILNTTEPTREVTAIIIYDDSLIKKEYRLMLPDGTLGEWKEYKEPLRIINKNTIVYARGQDEAEVWSNTAMKKVDNIDEDPPAIKLTADLETAMKKVEIRVEVTDDTKVEQVMWAQGIKGESYFENSGNIIDNNSVFNVEENGYYTIYAIDRVGNKSTSTVQVENIDKDAPDIEISTDTNTFGIETNIIITYGDSTLKQYKIGESNTTWSNYTDIINLTSNTVLAKGWKNEDNTVTVYAKGTDTAGNETIVSKKILTLDLDAPAKPEISSNYGYPKLTEYGVKFDNDVTIKYDSRNDITNYYSVDGKNWEKYTGTFKNSGNGTIYAKSVKASGLEISSSMVIKVKSNALGALAYNNNYSDCDSLSSSKYIYVDESLWGLSIKMKVISGWVSDQTIKFWGNQNNVLKSELLQGGGQAVTYNKTYTVPRGTTKIEFYTKGDYFRVYEIGIVDNPTVKALNSNLYPILTDKGIVAPKNKVEITYFPTAVKKLYSLDGTNWLEYKNAITIDVGKVIYAKSINSEGKDSQTTTYTVGGYASNRLGAAAYNNNYSDCDSLSSSKYIYVDESAWGKTIKVKVISGYASNQTIKIWGNKNNVLKSELLQGGSPAKTYNKTYTIQENTTKIEFYTKGDYFRVYEVQLVT